MTQVDLKSLTSLTCLLSATQLTSDVSCVFRVCFGFNFIKLHWNLDKIWQDHIELEVGMPEPQAGNNTHGGKLTLRAMEEAPSHTMGKRCTSE